MRLRAFKEKTCNGATPSESRIREIRTYGSMRGRRSKDLLLLCTKAYIRSEKVISAHKMIELRPGICGISFDLKEAFNFFKESKRH